MRRFMILMTAAALIVGVAGQSNAQTPRTMTMNGNASIAVKPDIIRITAGVMVHEKEASDAFRIMSDQLNQVADVLSREGIAPVDIQTSDLTLQERYGQNPLNERSEQIVIGYTASSALTVVVRDLDRAGDMVEVLVTQGANQIRGFAFDISDPTEALEQARLAAVQDAMDKIALYTKAAGITAGEVLVFHETSGHLNRPQAKSHLEDMSRSVPIAGGSLSVTASVSIVTEIE
jgi:uncharacterized protein YggE